MATQETQVGVAKIFSMIGATMVVLTGAATITMETASLEHNFTADDHEGQDGNVETIIGYNERLEISIDFAPNGAARTDAITSAANSWPAMLSKVVLSAFKVAKFNADFNYIGGASCKITKKGVAVMGVKLRRNLANSGTTTGLLQAAVIAT
jgi:hypothetical protein